MAYAETAVEEKIAHVESECATRMPDRRNRTGEDRIVYTAKDIMSRNFVSLAPNMDVLEAVDQLVRHNISGAPVVDRLGNLVGVLSEIDCMNAAVQASYHGSGAGKVSEVMRRDFKTVDVDDSIMEIAKKFAGQDYYRGFPVMKHNRVVGRIILRHVLQALKNMRHEQA